ncbi:hypothetical protein UA08_03203 [Talaromyces atroroseus]|uniref:Phospholipid-transporting ATPase n=1 Tax=Talaromyces atroroseus TaxID=1441469 RepID=A0A225AN28_TALAT|nr:hypothetical protein UA08_03203 [Talaromyces atroroseus]OKL60853.1 hypothetical protein UA08_03203 [Talaromyces atroroseus]
MSGSSISLASGSTIRFSSVSRRSSDSSSDIELPLLQNEAQQGSLFPYIQNIPKNSNPISVLRNFWAQVRISSYSRGQGRPRGFRHVEINALRTTPLVDERTGRPFVKNWIRSNRYTPLTFLPRQLFAQFSKLANFYFLCFALMQLIPGLSTIGNKTNIVPLMIFVSISMAKEGFDDYRRHRLDSQENRQVVLSLDKRTPTIAECLNWRKTQWRSLAVGDIIRLQRDEAVPADIVLLSSTSRAGSNIAHVETIALDGETNLKIKRVDKAVAEACATPADLVNCSVKFIIEDPHPDLSSFKGRVTVNDQDWPLNNDNIVYRGSVLRNISEATAMVVYSGQECKIRLNSNGDGQAHIKAPRLQYMVNKIVFVVASFVLGLSFYNTFAYQIWKSDIENKLFYLSGATVSTQESIFGFLIMFATMVPLSLYISMEMIKLAQIFFLSSDIDMYDEASNVPCEARTSTINEELGQITHIFSDKTGTLTDNEMRFRKMYVAGGIWAHEDVGDPNQDHIRAAERPNMFNPSSEQRSVSERTIKEMIRHFSERPDSAYGQKVMMMLLCMALCHSCIPEISRDGITIDFQSSSPDELALIRAAQTMGVFMRSRDHDSIILSLSTSKDTSIRTETYKVLNVIEFSNDRRRMSVIVRFPDGRICIICKGADSVIMERLKILKTTKETGVQSQSLGEQVDQGGNIGTVPHGDGQFDLENCVSSVTRFANESLRTLLYAYRFLDDAEYEEWRLMWDVATASLDKNEEMTDKVAELIEVNFELAGATAVEDKLQRGVPDSIDKLLRANIKVWMLTGDKRETAINIGHSCGLIKENSTILDLSDDDQSGKIMEAIESYILSLKSAEHGVVVIDGHTLTTIFNEPIGSLKARFFDLVVLADSVICCRTQPSQKAQVVRGIKIRMPNAVTLAVGDGANDIAMIQEAHVGIGITGKEGFQAARNSDYSIAQFRFLPKLLLVHGRWNYVRTCKYILGTLWKEIVFYLSQSLFQRWVGYSGTSLYEPLSATQFNTLFTSLSVMCIGVFDKDLAASTLLAVPELYISMGQRDGGFNIWIYLGWTAMAVSESCIVFFSMLFLFGCAETTKDNTLFSMGDLNFVAVVIIVSLKLLVLEMHNKSIVVAITMFLTVGAPFLWNLVFAAAYPLTTAYRVRGGFFTGFGQNPTWWLTLIFIIICVYMYELSISALRKAIFPTDTDVFQELEQDKAFMARYNRTTALESEWISNRYSDEQVDTTYKEYP